MDTCLIVYMFVVYIASLPLWLIAVIASVVTGLIMILIVACVATVCCKCHSSHAKTRYKMNHTSTSDVKSVENGRSVVCMGWWVSVSLSVRNEWMTGLSASCIVIDMRSTCEILFIRQLARCSLHCWFIRNVHIVFFPHCAGFLHGRVYTALNTAMAVWKIIVAEVRASLYLAPQVGSHPHWTRIMVINGSLVTAAAISVSLSPCSHLPPQLVTVPPTWSSYTPAKTRVLVAS